jgi:hypothetical protein
MELDFSNDVIEKLLLKKALIDKNWLNILGKTYDKRWFSIECIGITLKNILAFYNKYDSIPSIQTIQAISKKYIEKHGDTELNIIDVQQLLTEISNMNLNISDEVLNSNLKEFIRRNAFYYSLFDNAELLEKNSGKYDEVVDKCLANFDKVQKITFNDTDLGLDYFNENQMKQHWQYIMNPKAKIKTVGQI